MEVAAARPEPACDRSVCAAYATPGSMIAKAAAATTSVPPGHLVLGMELDPELRSLGIATPKGGDPPLIAVARIAVPRALELLSCAEENIAQHGLLDGCLSGEGAVAIAAAVAVFDRQRASEGSGTGTV